MKKYLISVFTNRSDMQIYVITENFIKIELQINKFEANNKKIEMLSIGTSL